SSERAWHMTRSPVVLLLPLAVLSSPSLAVATEPAAPPRLQASCVGAPAPGAPARLAVRWTGDEALGLVAWGDDDGDRVRDPGGETAAIRVVDPGFTVVELDRLPEGPLVVGPESESSQGVAALLAAGCEWSGDFFFADLDGTVRAFAVYDDGS